MTIASAIDKINDKLAGSDKYAPVTIEGALDYLADTIPQGGWGGGGGGTGYDAVVKLDDDALSNVTEGELVQGTYSVLQEKMVAGEYATILVYGCKEGYNTTFGLKFFKYDSYVEPGEDPILRVGVTDNINSMEFSILSDDTVSIN